MSMTLTRMIIVLTTLTAADKTHLRLINSTAISMLELHHSIESRFRCTCIRRQRAKIKGTIIVCPWFTLAAPRGCGVGGVERLKSNTAITPHLLSFSAWNSNILAYDLQPLNATNHHRQATKPSTATSPCERMETTSRRE